jgi:hypothetical protein
MDNINMHLRQMVFDNVEWAQEDQDTGHWCIHLNACDKLFKFHQRQDSHVQNCAVTEHFCIQVWDQHKKQAELQMAFSSMMIQIKVTQPGSR